MDLEQLANQLQRIEQAIVVIRDVVSETLGTMDADSVAITGLLKACADSPAVQLHVRNALEERMSKNLADCLNQPSFNSFSFRQEMLLTILNEAVDPENSREKTGG